MTGEFFAIDRRAWAKVCSLGMNPAVAFVVLARFSGRDNRTTSASTHAVETYTGIARSRARKAIDNLIAARLVKEKPGSTAARPLYDLYPSTTKPEWLWLPNAIVTGAAKEAPPVELIRQTQDVGTLRRSVDLYGAQNLREENGIDRRFLWKTHERERLAEHRQFVIWGFGIGTKLWITWGDPALDVHRRQPTEAERNVGKNNAVDLFARLERLTSTGLIEWIPFVFESDDATAEAIVPIGMRQGSTLEDEIGLAAYRAGARLLMEFNSAHADAGYWYVPLPKHLEPVAMISVARLRYRPQTKLTAAWFAESQHVAETYLAEFRRLAAGTKLESAIG